jgi:hypothetical protein
MGREATCRARLGDRSGRKWGPSAEGKALLETDDVIFRGPFRARVPLKEISGVVTRAGKLTLTWPGGRLELSLGAAAEKWAEAIRHPKSVLEKLGVKPGLRVAVTGKFDAGFITDLARALGTKPSTRPARGSDLVFAALAKPGDAVKVAGLVPAIAPDGAIWAVYPKGRKDLSEDTVRDAALATDLVDVKVVRFSEALGALKLVIPRARRAPR